MNESVLERYAQGDTHKLTKPLPGESFKDQLARVKAQLKESLHGKPHPLDQQHPLDRNHG